MGVIVRMCDRGLFITFVCMVLRAFCGQKYDAIQLKNEIEKVRKEMEEARDEYERQLAEEKKECEKAQKRRRTLEKENAAIAKRLHITDVENFEAFCSDAPAAAGAAAAASVTGGGMRLRSGSITAGVGGSSANAKTSQALSQFVC